jgi:ABC-2 type transport system permease protein
MLIDIFKFELQYRKARPATFIYFGVAFGLAFLFVTTPIIESFAGGLVKQNAPSVIHSLVSLFTLLFTMIISGIMGVAVQRDFEYNTEALMFSTPMKKFDYLMGRFLGSYFVAIIVMAAVPLGLMLGDLMPWRDATKMLPFSAAKYWNPYFIFVIPNVFFLGALFFASGALSRKSIVIYTQGILVLIAFLISGSAIRNIENDTIASLVDPLGASAVRVLSRYWSPAEQNSLLYPFSGYILYNRLVWIGMGILILVYTYFRFSFNVVPTSIFKAKALKETPKVTLLENLMLPNVTQNLGLSANWQRLWQMSKFYAKSLYKEVIFLSMTLIGGVFVLYGCYSTFDASEVTQQVTSANVIRAIGSFNLFLFLLAIIYPGELLWKERVVKMNLIVDAMPLPEWVTFLSKFFGFLLSTIGLFALVILVGVLVQIIHGNFNIEWSLYFKDFFLTNFLSLALTAALSMFLQVFINQKVAGYGLMVLVITFFAFQSKIGVEHPLLSFDSGSMGTYSDMNGFKNSLSSFVFPKIYWFAFVGLLFVGGIMLLPRGIEEDFETRWKVGKQRFLKPLRTATYVLLGIFVASGAWIFYNHNILNEYTGSKGFEKLSADYEKILKKKYQDAPQTKIVETNIRAELYPTERGFSIEGYYILKNKTPKAIAQIIIQNPYHDTDSEMAYLNFDRPSKKDSTNGKFGFMIYNLSTPLQPQDSVKMNFKTNFKTYGFMVDGSNGDVVENGTFINNQSYLPSLGYDDDRELGDKDDRKKYDLKERERLPSREDARGLSQNLFNNDADRIRFEAIIGTEKDQIAFAPGYLQRTWEEKGRQYFHYKMDAPMVNFYNIVSGRYEVKKERYKGIDLAVHYHKGHDWNVPTMFRSLKDALDYYTQNFSPFQYRQMRLMEVPKYHGFAQSFANTVPFDEDFLLMRVKDDKHYDDVYQTVAHETAHQWWGHQVTEAGVKGSAALSEMMSQYSSLMVMKHHEPAGRVKNFHKLEMENYLRGRTSETIKEQPLALVEGQSYIHYNKGSVAMFALQDYIGEKNVNKAIAQYAKDWGMKDKYPTTKDLFGYLKAATPDSLKPMFEDFFENIVLFENKAESVSVKKKDKNHWELTLKATAEKFKADGTGDTKPVKVNDWIEVGVYGKDDKLLYMAKHKVTQKDNTFTITVNEEPLKAGIDPENKLIDRHSKDNVKEVK